MLSQDEKIRQIHENRTGPELCRKSCAGAEEVSDEVIATAQSLQNALAESNGIGSPAGGLFVLALQQVVDSFIAGLITEEAFDWLAQERRRDNETLLGGTGRSAY